MNLFGDHMLLIALVVLLLAGVLVFFLMSQHNLKASTRRIKEEFGQPGERDTLPPNVEPPVQSPWDAAGERSSAEVLAELDAKIERASYLVNSAAEQIKRLETLIAESERIGRAANPVTRDQPPAG
jgi:hypothetical protein